MSAQRRGDIAFLGAMSVVAVVVLAFAVMSVLGALGVEAAKTWALVLNWAMFGIATLVLLVIAVALLTALVMAIRSRRDPSRRAS